MQLLHTVSTAGPSAFSLTVLSSSQQLTIMGGNKIIFLCDVEGNWDYFCRFVAISAALSFTDGSDGSNARGALEMTLTDGYDFVFAVLAHYSSQCI